MNHIGNSRTIFIQGADAMNCLSGEGQIRWIRRLVVTFFLLIMGSSVVYIVVFLLIHKIIVRQDISDFIGSAAGAIFAVLGAIYVEKRRLSRASVDDRFLLAEAITTIANNFNNREVKSNPNYLLTGLDGVEQILLNQENFCIDGIDLLTEARSAVSIEDFKTLNILRNTRSILIFARDNFAYLRQQFPDRGSHEISDEDFIDVIDRATADIGYRLAETAISLPIRGQRL